MEPHVGKYYIDTVHVTKYLSDQIVPDILYIIAAIKVLSAVSLLHSLLQQMIAAYHLTKTQKQKLLCPEESSGQLTDHYIAVTLETLSINATYTSPNRNLYHIN